MSPWKVEISSAPVVGIVVPSARIKAHSIANGLEICAVDSAVCLVSWPNASFCKASARQGDKSLLDLFSESICAHYSKKYPARLSLDAKTSTTSTEQ